MQFFRRKKWLIYPKLQWNFIIYSVGISVAVAVIYFFSMRFFFASLANKGVELGIPTDHIYFRFLQEQESIMSQGFIATSLVVTLILVFWGLYLSNQVAGPIYKIQNYLHARMKGEKPGDLKLRKNDYFHELADSINQTFEKQPVTQDVQK